MSTFDDIAGLVGLDDRHRGEIPWAQLEGALGFEFPADFKEFVETFPPGLLRGSFFVFHPHHADLDFVDTFRVVGSSFHGLVETDGESVHFPHDFYPARGGLIPWADFDTEVVLCWNPVGHNSDKWPIVACNTSLEYQELSGSTIACLYDVISGNAPRGVFPEYFWRSEPTFRAVPRETLT
jgi:hypothetical protein